MCLLDYYLFIVLDNECVYVTSACAYIQTKHHLLYQGDWPYHVLQGVLVIYSHIIVIFATLRLKTQNTTW